MLKMLKKMADWFFICGKCGETYKYHMEPRACPRCGTVNKGTK